MNIVWLVEEIRSHLLSNESAVDGKKLGGNEVSPYDCLRHLVVVLLKVEIMIQDERWHRLFDKVQHDLHVELAPSLLL